jgi:hypothetical protein
MIESFRRSTHRFDVAMELQYPSAERMAETGDLARIIAKVISTPNTGAAKLLMISAASSSVRFLAMKGSLSGKPK